MTASRGHTCEDLCLLVLKMQGANADCNNDDRSRNRDSLKLSNFPGGNRLSRFCWALRRHRWYRCNAQQESSGRHPTFGTMYYWSLSAVALSATALAVVRWADDYHLFVLGLLAFTAATLGRIARRQRWDHWAWFHVVGMGLSYILLLTALYVDNGKSLPIWRDLPSITYWLLPSLVGIPLIVLRWHPVVRRRPWPER
jgi:hypothetical protein